MIGNYGRLPGAKVQEFVAEAIHRESGIEAIKVEGFSACVTVHTDGVMLITEENAQERRQGFTPAFRLVAGRKYRVTVEELD